MVSKMRSSVRLLIILAVSLAIVFDTTSVSANTRYYERNNILYYSKDATEPATCTPGVSFSTTTKLPDKTIKNLESQKVKEKAEKNKSSYQKAEKATGVPWTMLATLHFREAGMDSGRSLSNGEPITGTKYKNKADGVWVGANLDEDAILAAQHFIEMASAKDLYKIDVTKGNLTTEEIGRSFLAYNRGRLYKRANLDYTDSGYVMQGIDEKHIGGDWIYLDPFGGHSKSREYENSNPGALAVLSYLGMNVGTSSCKGTPFEGDFASFGQCDERWGKLKYSSGSFCSSACGVVSTAMIITTLKKEEYTPDKIIDKVREYGGEIVGSGSSGANLAKMMKDEYKLTLENLNVSNKSGLKERIETALDKGGIILTSGKGGRPYSSGGHFVVIYKKMENGKWLIGDPAGKEGTSTMQGTIRESSFASNPKNILKEYEPSAITTYAHNEMVAVYAK